MRPGVSIIGRMENHHKFTVKSFKEHSVSAVVFINRFFLLSPWSCEPAGVRNGNPKGISSFASACPDHVKLPCFTFVQKGAVSHITSILVADLTPGSLASAKQIFGFTRVHWGALGRTTKYSPNNLVVERAYNPRNQRRHDPRLGDA